MAKDKKKKIDDEDVAHDYALMDHMCTHIHVYGFVSVVDNLEAACERKVAQWKERLGKVQKIRKVLGRPSGRN